MNTGFTAWCTKQTFHLPLLTYNKSFQQMSIDNIRDFIFYFNQIVKDYILNPPTSDEVHQGKGKFYSYFSHVVTDSEKNNTPVTLKTVQLVKAADSIFRSSNPKKLAWIKQSNIVDQQIIKKCYSDYSSIELIPKELLQYIFNFIAPSNWSEIGQFALTCKTFYNLTNDRILLKISLEKQPQLFSSIYSPKLRRKILDHSHFIPIKIPQSQVELTDSDLKMIADYGEKLEHLSLRGSKFSLEGLIYLLHHCPNLKSLEFYDIHHSQFDEFIAAMSMLCNAGKLKIESLKIINCHMTDQALFALTLQPFELRSFEFENSLSKGLLTDYGMVLFFSFMDNLESIKLTGCPGVSLLSILFYITNKCKKIDLAKGQLLKELNFSFCGEVNQQLLNSIAEHCPNLEKLELGFNKNQIKEFNQEMTDGSINLSQKCQHLHSMKFSQCDFITAPTIKEMIRNLKFQIQSLELFQSNPITGDFFEALSHCSGLRSFKFRPLTPQVLNEENLKKIFQNCPELEVLSLMNCQILEKDLLKYINKLKLKTLQLVACGAFGSSLLKALSTECPHLEVLEIDTAQATRSPMPFDDESLAALTKQCRFLTHLSLNSSLTNNIKPWQLTEKSLQSIEKNCPQLVSLTLSHLNLVRASKKDELNEIQKILISFTSHCLKISHLAFPSVQAAGDQLEALILPYQSQLLSLSLERSPKLESDFYKIIAKCTRLNTLILSHSTIEMETIDHLLNSLPFLQYLDVKGCQNLTDKWKVQATKFPFLCVIQK